MFLHKLLLIIIIILLFYIYTRLIYHNQYIQVIHEPLTILKSSDSEFGDIEKNASDIYINNLQSIPKESAVLPLREYCIKSSYNSAVTGSYINAQMVNHLLKRGCRLFDFEIFFINEDNKFIPVVGYTHDNKYNIIESKNTVPLNEIFNLIMMNAFSEISPNRTDPVFINLRIKSNDTGIYSAIAKIIHSTIKPKIYNGKVSGDTILNELFDKIIIMVDKTIDRNYVKNAECDHTDLHCYDFNNYINMESGSENVNLFHFSSLIGQAYTPVLVKDDNVRTTVSNIRMAIPDKTPITSNPEMKDYIVKYNCQIIAYMFYIIDNELNEYEEFFNTSRSSFVPLSFALSYFTKKS